MPFSKCLKTDPAKNQLPTRNCLKTDPADNQQPPNWLVPVMRQEPPQLKRQQPHPLAVV